MLPAVRNGSWLTPSFAWPTNRLDTIFDRVFGEEGPLSQATTAAAAPLSLWEDEHGVHVEMDAPGVAEGDVEVTFHEGLLTIRYERKPAEGRRYAYNGRAFGKFERTLRLPETIKADAVEARLTGGVLYLSLPKSPESKPRRIEVRGS